MIGQVPTPLDDARPLDLGTTAEGARRVRREAGVTCYSRGPLFLMVWFEGPRLPVVERNIRDLRALMLEHPGGVLVLNVMELGANPPDAEALTRVREFFREEGNAMRGNCMLIDGGGFMASATLGLTTALVAARRESFPERVCRTTSEAAEFLLGRSVLDPATTRASLEALIADVRIDARLPLPMT
jgi:hypothetical protein